MDVARDAVTELANTVSSDAFALARVLESDVAVDAPAILGALATTSLHLATSTAEMAKAFEAAGAGAVPGSGPTLRHLQSVLATCSATLMDMIDPPAGRASTLGR